MPARQRDTRRRDRAAGTPSPSKCGLVLRRTRRLSDRARWPWRSRRAPAYKSKGDVDRAIAVFNEAITLNPKYAIAYYNRGAAHSAKGDVDHAIADFNEAANLAWYIGWQSRMVKTLASFGEGKGGARGPIPPKDDGLQGHGAGNLLPSIE